MNMGRVYLPKEAWYVTDVRKEFASFTAELTHKHDDIIDTCIDCWDYLTNPDDENIADYLEYIR